MWEATEKTLCGEKEEWMRMLEYSFICSQQQSYNTTSYPIPRRNMQPKTPTAVDLCVCVGVHCKKYDSSNIDCIIY